MYNVHPDIERDGYYVNKNKRHFRPHVVGGDYKDQENWERQLLWK